MRRTINLFIVITLNLVASVIRKWREITCLSSYEYSKIDLFPLDFEYNLNNCALKLELCNEVGGIF